MLRFSVLGSGSSGNSAVVCFGDTRVLIDAGLSARQLCLRLEAIGIDPNSLTAIVLTHEHGDHAGGLDVFCRKRAPLVYATSHTCEMVAETVRSRVAWRKFEAGETFAIEGLRIETFSVPHDAVDPVGFVFRGERTAVGVLSDVGHVTALIRERLRGVDSLFVESNYDELMLQNDTKRPWSTKQRISSRHGHLSNDQTAELVVEIASERLHRVVLGHLSRDCNAPEVATAAIRQRLERAGFPGVDVECARQKEALPLRDAGHPAPPVTEAAPEEAPLLLREPPAEHGNATPSRSPRAAHHGAADGRRSKRSEPAPPTPLRQAEWVF